MRHRPISKNGSFNCQNLETPPPPLPLPPPCSHKIRNNPGGRSRKHCRRLKRVPPERNWLPEIRAITIIIKEYHAATVIKNTRLGDRDQQAESRRPYLSQGILERLSWPGQKLNTAPGRNPPPPSPIANLALLERLPCSAAHR